MIVKIHVRANAPHSYVDDAPYAYQMLPQGMKDLKKLSDAYLACHDLVKELLDTPNGNVEEIIANHFGEEYTVKNKTLSTRVFHVSFLSIHEIHK